MSSPEAEIALSPDHENAESDGEFVVSGDVPDVEVVEVFNAPEVIHLSPVLREAFRRLDRIDLETIFSKRAVVMKTVPPFLKGPYRSPMRIAMAEATCDEHVRRSRGWKLILLLPRMLLCRKARGGLISREAFCRRDSANLPRASGSPSSSSRKMFRRLPVVRWFEGGAAQVMTLSGEQPGPTFLFRWVSCHRAGLHWKRRKSLQDRKVRCSSCRNRSGATSTKGTHSSTFVGAQSAR